MPYLFSVTVGSLRAVCRPPQSCPVVVKVSRRIHLMLSQQMQNMQHTVIFTLLPILCFTLCELMIFTSKMKNLAVFALPQVFFRRDTGLMFMPATHRNGFQPLIPDHARVFTSNNAQLSQNGTHRWWPWGSWSCRCWNTPWQRRWRTLSPGPSASSSPAWKKGIRDDFPSPAQKNYVRYCFYIHQCSL